MLDDPRLAGYPPLHAAHADLLDRAGEPGAAEAWTRAAELSTNPAQRDQLLRRAGAPLSRGAPPGRAVLDAYGRRVEHRQVHLTDGVVINCLLSGDPDAPAMVLLHALGEQAASWDEVGAQFAKRFRMVALELRGHGASSWPGTYSLTLMRDDVLGVLDALGLHDVVLVGHSMGGAVAYLVAQAQPARIARLVVEDAPPPFPRERPVPERPAAELPFDWAVVPAIVAEIDDPTLRWWRHLPDITAPTLLIGGGPSSSIPQELLIDVAAAVPNCTLVTIPAGHDVHESDPGAFVQTVLTWLRNLASPPR